MILSSLSILLLCGIVGSTYYTWPSQRRWHVQERSGEELYPGTYLGEGSAALMRGYAELSCTLNTFEGYIVSNVVWSKMRGEYAESFYPCPQCYPQDPRIRAYDHRGKSILLMRDPSPVDRGVYRCSATAQFPDGRLTTIYQIVHLM